MNQKLIPTLKEPIYFFTKRLGFIHLKNNQVYQNASQSVNYQFQISKYLFSNMLKHKSCKRCLTLIEVFKYLKPHSKKNLMSWASVGVPR